MTDKKPIDFYYTIETTERSEIKVKASKFIATAHPVTNKDEVIDFLNKIRHEFYDATHHCYAYRFGPEGLDFRTADDGEPSGSAGKPILFAIKKYDLSDVIVVVTRYFGGTKLGVGGLARAYSDSTCQTLEKCIKKIIHRTVPVRVFCTYQDISVIKRLVSQYAVRFEETYHDAIEIIAHIRLSQTEEFADLVNSETNARAGCIIQKTKKEELN